jgi:hypothetical protein
MTRYGSVSVVPLRIAATPFAIPSHDVKEPFMADPG